MLWPPGARLRRRYIEKHKGKLEEVKASGFDPILRSAWVPRLLHTVAVGMECGGDDKRTLTLTRTLARPRRAPAAAAGSGSAG